MSFRAEPYGVFVDDLVTSITGGATRDTFRFLPETAPYRARRSRTSSPGRCVCTASRATRTCGSAMGSTSTSSTR